MPHITHMIESNDIRCSSSTTTSTGSTPCKGMPLNVSVHACVLCLQHAWRPSTACFASFTSNTWDTLQGIDKKTKKDSNKCDTFKGNWHISKQTRCQHAGRLSMFKGINLSWCYTMIVTWDATREGKNKACRYKSFYLSHFPLLVFCDHMFGLPFFQVRDSPWLQREPNRDALTLCCVQYSASSMGSAGERACWWDLHSQHFWRSCEPFDTEWFATAGSRSFCASGGKQRSGGAN